VVKATWKDEQPMKTNLIKARITNSRFGHRAPVLSPAALATDARIARGYMRLLRAILFETPDWGSPLGMQFAHKERKTIK
jgi:hypothetical protein